MKKFIKKVGTAFMASALVASSAVSAFAASSKESNNTATTNDLANADIIDTSKKGSIKIYKYDIASAKEDGVYEAGDKKTTGEQDTELENKMAKYAIEGVEFTYLRCGEVETCSVNTGHENFIELAFEIPDKLREVLGLQTDDAIDMNAKNVANPCQKAGVYHYTSQQLDDAIKKILEDDNIAGKDALEDYVTSNQDAVRMPLTNDKGFTNADQLELGLYLFVETKVPEEVTDTVNPWFIQLPFTNTDPSKDNSAEVGGNYWLYDATVYPKNQTGNPTLEKLVRNAHGKLPDTAGSYEDYSYLVSNEVEGTQTEYPNRPMSDPNSGMEGPSFEDSGTSSDDGPSIVEPSVTDDGDAAGDDVTNPAPDAEENTDGQDTADGQESDSSDVNDQTADNQDSEDQGGADESDEQSPEVSSTPDEQDSEDDASNGTAENAFSSSFSPFEDPSFEGQVDPEKKDETEDSGDADADADSDPVGEPSASPSPAVISTQSQKDYVESREEYHYSDTGTASAGDILDYILVSKLPHITSKATYLTQYTFVDVLSEGLEYDHNVRVAFYTNEEDAKVNNTKNADTIWGFSKNDVDYIQKYADVLTTYNQPTGQTTLTVSFTENGLNLINTKFSDYYMVVYYTATVNSDATAVMGDAGNSNDVVLKWERTSDDFYNTLEDRTYVYTYGINLKKEFSDGNGDATKVQFNLYNKTDAYYVQADESENVDGKKVYYVTGKTPDQEKATVFSPDENGALLINGLEADTYQLTEIGSDDGYSILKDQIIIDIKSASLSTHSEIGHTGKDDGDTHTHTDACYAIDRNDNRIKYTDSNGEQHDILICGYSEDGSSNGRTIGKTTLYESDVVNTEATVDNVEAVMSNYTITQSTDFDGVVNSRADKVRSDIDSENARVDMKITNSKAFRLPITGGTGMVLLTAAGIVAVAAGGYFIITRKKQS